MSEDSTLERVHRHIIDAMAKMYTADYRGAAEELRSAADRLARLPIPMPDPEPGEGKG
jgi:hypothetical protein